VPQVPCVARDLSTAQLGAEKPMSKPSDICIVISAFPGAHEDGWLAADQIAHRLKRLGFECSTQQVAAWLRRLSQMEAPPIESHEGWWREKAYRVTKCGETWVHNVLPDIWWAQANARDRLRREISGA
jgi:hypothetical protein